MPPPTELSDLPAIYSLIILPDFNKEEYMTQPPEDEDSRQGARGEVKERTLGILKEYLAKKT